MHASDTVDTAFKRVISTEVLVLGLKKLVPLHFEGLLRQKKLLMGHVGFTTRGPSLVPLYLNKLFSIIEGDVLCSGRV